jgi:hypothetical protein
MSELVKCQVGSMDPAVKPESGSLVSREDGSLVRLDDRPQVPATRSARPSRLAVAVIGASVLAAVAVGAAAFGGGSGLAGSGPDAAAAHGNLAASASNSASAHSFAFTISAMQTSPGSMSTLVSGAGSIDLAKGVGQMTATVPAVSSLVGGGSHDSITVISDGSDVYMDVPAFSSVTGGKRWLEASIASASSMSGGLTGSLSLSILADPSKLLGFLGTLSGKVATIGNVQLDGVKTTEYKTTITVAGIVAQLDLGGQQSGSGSAAAKALPKLGVPTIPVTAWVGEDGTLRQVSVSIDLSHATIGGLLGSLGSSSTASSAPGTGTEVTVTLGLSHYGEPVSITVPPASDVTNLNGIFSSLHGAISRVGGAWSGIADRV